MKTYFEEHTWKTGKLGNAYYWVTVPGTQFVRPNCVPCVLTYKWAMEISKDYPKTVNKHTRSHHAHPVVYQGLLVQVWKCPGCGQTVVK